MRDDLPGHAFISYVREDSHRVDQLQRVLEAAGVRVWRDTADLWPGQDWRVEIRRAINDNALAFLACFSFNSLAREVSYQNEELALAIDQIRLRRPDRSWLIPVRFDEVDIPDLDLGGGRTLASIQCADLFGSRYDEGTMRLVEAVLRILRARSDSSSGQLGPTRLAELVHQMLLAGKQTKYFNVAIPGQQPSKLLRNAAEYQQLRPDEAILAAWLENDGYFSLGTTYCLAFTTSGLRISSGGFRLHIPYRRFTEYKFEKLSKMYRAGGGHSRAGTSYSYSASRLAIEGAGHEWTSFEKNDGEAYDTLLAHLNAIKLLVSETSKLS
jgi:hypothetical protein